MGHIGQGVQAFLFLAALSIGLGMAEGPVQGLPVASLAEVGRAAVTAGQAGVCGGVPIFGARLAVAGGEYEFYTDNVRWLLADRADGQETPVWAGAVSTDGQLRVVERLTYRQWMQRYPDGCSYFMQGA